MGSFFVNLIVRSCNWGHSKYIIMGHDPDVWMIEDNFLIPISELILWIYEGSRKVLV